MNFEKFKRELAQISKEYSLNDLSAGWHGVDVLWPLVEKIRTEGSVFILKVDGERVGKNVNGPYTTAIIGGPLEDEGIRIDCQKLEDALAYSIVEFAKRIWGFQPE